MFPSASLVHHHFAKRRKACFITGLLKVPMHYYHFLLVYWNMRLQFWTFKISPQAKVPGVNKRGEEAIPQSIKMTQLRDAESRCRGESPFPSLKLAQSSSPPALPQLSWWCFLTIPTSQLLQSDELIFHPTLSHTQKQSHSGSHHYPQMFLFLHPRPDISLTVTYHCISPHASPLLNLFFALGPTFDLSTLQYFLRTLFLLNLIFLPSQS